MTEKEDQGLDERGARGIGLPLLLIAMGIWAVLGGYLSRRS